MKKRYLKNLKQLNKYFKEVNILYNISSRAIRIQGLCVGKVKKEGI